MRALMVGVKNIHYNSAYHHPLKSHPASTKKSPGTLSIQAEEYAEKANGFPLGAPHFFILRETPRRWLFGCVQTALRQ